MLRPSNVRVSYKIAALGAVGIFGLLLVGVIFFIGLESQSRYQKLADDATVVSTTTKNILVQLLQLRRHEKDFMLRGDLQYRDQFNKAVTTFADAVAASAIAASEKDDIGKKLSVYQREFVDFVDAALSLATRQRETSAAYAKIEPDMDAIAQAIAKLASEADAAAANVRDETARLLGAAILGALVTVSVFAFLIGRGITKPLAALVGLLQRIAKGEEVEIAGIERRDEI